MRRGEKIKSMEAEYVSLTTEVAELQKAIKAEWTTASVQRMREIDGRITECELRLLAIRRSEAYHFFKLIKAT